MEKKSNIGLVLLGLGGLGLIIYFLYKRNLYGFYLPQIPEMIRTEEIIFKPIERAWNQDVAQMIANQVGVRILKSELVQSGTALPNRKYIVEGTEENIRLFESYGRKPVEVV